MVVSLLLSTPVKTVAESNKTLADGPLVEACLDGDQDAWAELVSRYGRLVLAIPHHYGFAEHDAHDVFQTVFATLVVQLPRLRDHASLAKWLITTTHRTAWRHRRAHAREISLDDVPLETAEAPSDVAMRWERQQTVRTALRRLGGRCEQLLTALYLDESSPGYDEVALRLDIPRGSIGPTRRRCLAKLLALLREGRAVS